MMCEKSLAQIVGQRHSKKRDIDDKHEANQQHCWFRNIASVHALTMWMVDGRRDDVLQ